MLDLSKLSIAERIDSPFKHSKISHLISSEDADKLLSALPKYGNYRASREGGSDKIYNVVNNILLVLGEQSYNKESHLNFLWIDLIQQLQDKKYRGALSALLNDDLTTCPMEITLKRYKFKDFISPHTDKDSVRATHMIFLNNEWHEDWGGLLHLMYDDVNTYQTFLPMSANSVAFVRSDASWHKVCPILKEEKERIALQVAFWNKIDRLVAPGRHIKIEAY